MAPRERLSAAETAFAAAQRVARLGTTDVEGHPHVVPVCYAFDGTQFYTPLDEKPKKVSDRQLRRARNIEAHPEVCLLIDRYEDDWSRLGYLLVHGRATLLPPQDSAHAPALLLLRERYAQYRDMSLEAHHIIAVAPKRVVSWGPALDQYRETP